MLDALIGGLGGADLLVPRLDRDIGDQDVRPGAAHGLLHIHPGLQKSGMGLLALCDGLAQSRRQPPAGINGLAQRDPHAFIDRAGTTAAEVLRQLNVTFDIRAHLGTGKLDAIIRGLGLMLALQDNRVIAQSNRNGLVQRFHGGGPFRQSGKRVRVVADRGLVTLARDVVIALRCGKRCVGGGQLRLGQGHIGAGDFAYVETVP